MFIFVDGDLFTEVSLAGIVFAFASGTFEFVNAESKTTLKGIPFDICSFIFFSNAVFDILLPVDVTLTASLATSLLLKINFMFF